MDELLTRNKPLDRSVTKDQFTLPNTVRPKREEYVRDQEFNFLIFHYLEDLENPDVQLLFLLPSSIKNSREGEACHWLRAKKRL